MSIEQDTGDEIRVRVDADGAGYLVVAESLGSGWAASVDGAAATIRAADQAFGAVAVPEGAHEIVFEQVGVHRVAGNLISAGALVADPDLLGRAGPPGRRDPPRRPRRQIVP